MARRRLTVKRIDPWSVLKFGAVVNLAIFAILMLVVGVVLFIVDRLGLIAQVCEIARDVGFTACGLNLGNLFRAVALLGLLAMIIQTAVLVFASFLHNLIADLTGGLTVSVIDDSPVVGRPEAAGSGDTTSRGPSTAGTGRPPVAPLGGGRGDTRQDPRAADPSEQRRDARERESVERTSRLRGDEDDLFGGR